MYIYIYINLIYKSKKVNDSPPQSPQAHRRTAVAPAASSARAATPPRPAAWSTAPAAAGVPWLQDEAP